MVNSIEDNLKTILLQDPSEVHYNFHLTKHLTVNGSNNPKAHVMNETVTGHVLVNSEKLGKKQVLKVSANVSATFKLCKNDLEAFQFNKTVSFNGQIKMKGDEDKNKNLAYSRTFSLKSDSDVKVRYSSVNGTFKVKCKQNRISSHVFVFKHEQCTHCRCTVLGTAFHHQLSTVHSKKNHLNGSKVFTVENSGHQFSTFTVCNNPEALDEETTTATITTEAKVQPNEAVSNDNKLQ